MLDAHRPTAADLHALLDVQTGNASRDALVDRALANPVSALELRLLLALEGDAEALAQQAARPVHSARGWRFALPASALAVAALLFTWSPRNADVSDAALAIEAAAGTQLAQLDARPDQLLGGSFEASDRFAGDFE